MASDTRDKPHPIIDLIKSSQKMLADAPGVTTAVEMLLRRAYQRGQEDGISYMQKKFREPPEN